MKIQIFCKSVANIKFRMCRLPFLDKVITFEAVSETLPVNWFLDFSFWKIKLINWQFKFKIQNLKFRHNGWIGNDIHHDHLDLIPHHQTPHHHRLHHRHHPLWQTKIHRPTRVVMSKGAGPSELRMDIPTIAKTVKKTNLEIGMCWEKIRIKWKIKMKNKNIKMWRKFHLMIMICLSVVLVRKFHNPSNVVVVTIWETCNIMIVIVRNQCWWIVNIKRI